MELEKLPTVVTEHEFTEDGYVRVDDGAIFVPAYVASQLGFNDSGKVYLHEHLYPDLMEMGVLPLCPFTACGEYLYMDRILQHRELAKQRDEWDAFNRKVGQVNYRELMPRAKFMIALLDGGHAVDDGVSAEIPYFTKEFDRPIVAIRSDVRAGENLAAVINPAVQWFLDIGPYTNKVAGKEIDVPRLYHGPGCTDAALEGIDELASALREESILWKELQ